MLFSLVLACVAGLARDNVDYDYEHLRYSVVRIQAVSSDFDWLTPFYGGNGGVSLGTGWVVETEPRVLFVTNAHVVSNAVDVALQLLVHSNRKWKAEVVSICSTFDLALLVLKEPEEFLAALKEKDMAVKALPVSSSATRMGERVVALGFPLGQDSLKISAGVVAGSEEVSGHLSIQSTAPLSPGSSGGPLLSEDGATVVGVNFAKSAASSAENINYVIPWWRVKAMVATTKHHEGVERLSIRVPSADATTSEANDALRSMCKCKEGLFLAAVHPHSFFAHATPPIEGRTFLTKVRGVAIDEYGMGYDPAYCEDQVRYTDLFFMTEDLEDKVEVEACHDGKIQKHTVPLGWDKSYESGMQYIEEPVFETKLTEFELFGDVSVMQLTLNHVGQLINMRPEIARYLHPDEEASSHVVLHYVKPGSYASEFLYPGSVITKVNGHEVRTLDDFRKHFIPDALSAPAKEGFLQKPKRMLHKVRRVHKETHAHTAEPKASEPAVKSEEVVWTLETDQGEMYVVYFDGTLTQQLAEAEVTQSASLLSSVVLDAAVARNVLGDSPPPFVSSMLMKQREHSFVRAAGAQPRTPLAPERVHADVPIIEKAAFRPTLLQSMPHF